MRLVQWLILPVVICLTGCHKPPTSIDDSASDNILSSSSQFDPGATGMIVGKVAWSGEIPTVPPILVDRPEAERSMGNGMVEPNPHQPRINVQNKGLGSAVVFLRGIDPAKGRPWDHAAVTVETHDQKPLVRQGDAAPGLIGFVCRGDAVTFVSRQSVFHAVRVRGAAFFTLTLPDADRPRTRQFSQVGYVELTSAAGHNWMHGHLFVDDHPYYVLTDDDGRFTLRQVPAGKYELVCWLPNWRIARIERDPESLMRTRVVFSPPLQQTGTITVHPGETATVAMEMDG